MKIHNREFYNKLLEKTVESGDCVVWNGTKTIRLPGKYVTVTFRRAIVYAVLGKLPAGAVNTDCSTKNCVKFDHLGFHKKFLPPDVIQSPRKKILEITDDQTPPMPRSYTRTGRQLYTDQQMFLELKRIKEQISRIPSIKEWNELSVIRYETVLRRFKRWHNFLGNASEFFKQS